MEKIVHVSLRLPESLHDAAMALATSERRSMHAQIVYLIEQATGVRDTVKRRPPRRRPAQRSGGEQGAGTGE